MNPLVIYHTACPDGYCAAWVAARALGNVELYPGEYGKEPPYELARARQVYIVDFSYPREQLLKLNDQVTKLRVLDHHATAQKDLEGLEWCVFDMNRSGAGITWDYFHLSEPRPWIVDYTEDRDLGRFALPNSQEISLRIRVTPHELEAWDDLAAKPVESVLSEAIGCKLYLDHYVRDAVRQAYVIPVSCGSWSISVACVNVSYTGVSDVLHTLLTEQKTKVALGWHLAADGKLNCSLRSTKDFDCSVLAKMYGGGGHAQASGFRLDLQESLAKQLMQ
jgi:uncharacterized protein